MKHFLLALLIMTGCMMQQSCETSEGVKAGILQKVSHKTFPCEHYEIQIGYAAGVSTGVGDKASYSAAQDIKIDQAAYDSLQMYVGENVIFEYNDDGVALCGPSKTLTYIRLKNLPTQLPPTPDSNNVPVKLTYNESGKLIEPKESDVKYTY